MRRTLPALLLTGCAVLALAAPAAAQEAPVDAPPPEQEAPEPPIPAVWAPVPVDAAGQSAYGLYLSGLLASLRGGYAEGAELLSESQRLVPEQPRVGVDAVRAGLKAGDLDAIVRMSPAIRNDPGFAEVRRLTEAVEAVRRGDAAVGLATLQADGFTDAFGLTRRFLLAPVAAAAGDWDTALAPVVLAPGDPGSMVRLHQRAQLLEIRRRYAEAEADHRTLLAVPVATQLFGADYAAFLKRRGREAEALAYYESVLASVAPDGPPPTAQARELADARPPAAPTPVQLAAEALRFAAIFLGADPDARPLVLAHLRMAENLHLDGETALFLGQTLVADGQEAEARAVFARVGADSPLRHANAQLEIGASFAREDRKTDALAAFQRARAAAPGQPQILRVLAAQLIDLDRHEEALAIIDDPSSGAARRLPDVREVRALALQKLGRIEEAEAELWAALQAAPEDASLLNTLGYMWVDTGRRVDQGAEMLVRAYAAAPDNGSIQDSLGWAQFRQGQFERAVETLEGAVGKLPANAVIVDHLGDAYWRVGRRREAEWQWSRVLTLDPEAGHRAEVERKLAHGLAPPPVSASQP